MVETKTPDLHTESLLSWQIVSTLPTNTVALQGSSEGWVQSGVFVECERRIENTFSILWAT